MKTPEEKFLDSLDELLSKQKNLENDTIAMLLIAQAITFLEQKGLEPTAILVSMALGIDAQVVKNTLRDFEASKANLPKLIKFNLN